MVPAGQPKQPRQAAPAKAKAVDELFPEELAGGIPVPEKAINFDKFAIDTTPVKVTGRKSSRVGGMSKEQYTKMTRIMAAVIGGALLLCIVLITLSYLKSGKPAAPAAADGTTQANAASKPQESKPADALADKPTKSDAHGTASSDKVATDAGKGAKTDAGKGAEPKKRLAATPKRRPATKSKPAAKPAADSTAKAEGAATGKAAEKPARDPNAPIGPNDPVAPLDNLPPDQQ